MITTTAAEAGSALCWFCGDTKQRVTLGYSFPVVVDSDFRLCAPQPGEFESDSLGQGSAIATICDECVEAFCCRLHSVSSEYLEAQGELKDVSSVFDADLAGGLERPENRVVRYGCWFDSFPILKESQYFTGSAIAELVGWGVRVIERFNTTRENLDSFLSRVPEYNTALSITPAEAFHATRLLTLSNGELTGEDRIRVACAPVWVLDASVLKRS